MAHYDKYMCCKDCDPSDLQPELFSDKRVPMGRWVRCAQCGRLMCPHVGSPSLCPDCWKAPRMPEPIEAGERMVRVWRTEYGAYQSQTNPRHYRKKDADEWLSAAQSLKLTAHMTEKGNYVKWRDWYGRPCGLNYPEFALWVEVPSAKATQGIYDAIRAVRRDSQLARLEQIHAKPKAEWQYTDHEDWHRMIGSL